MNGNSKGILAGAAAAIATLTVGAVSWSFLTVHTLSVTVGSLQATINEQQRTIASILSVQHTDGDALDKMRETLSNLQGKLENGKSR